MSISEAIIRLRNTLELTQADFAKAAGIGLRTLSRLEAGAELGTQTLVALADLAKEKEITHLHAVFNSLLQARLIEQRAAHRKNLPSAGTARAITVDELVKRAQDDERNRLAWEHVRKFVELAKRKIKAETNRDVLITRLTADLDGLWQNTEEHLATAKDLVAEDLIHLLGPPEISPARAEVETVILNPHKYPNPKKHARQMIDGYLRPKRTARPRRKKHTRTTIDSTQAVSA